MRGRQRLRRRRVRLRKGAALLQPRGPQGHAGAQYLLAFMYRDGNAVPEDKAKSVALFTSAAEQGHPDAQEYLAWRYMSRQQYSLAAKYYKMAADQGVQGARYHFDKATKLAEAECGEAAIV